MLAQGSSFTGTAQVIDAADCVAGVGVTAVSFRDTAGGANTVDVYDGVDATGKLIASITVASNAGGTISFPHPLRARAGIYVATTGACKGTVWVA